MQKKAFIHFHPAIKAELKGQIIDTNLGKIRIEGSENIELTSYLYAEGYNNRVEAQKIIITFAGVLETNILFKEL